MTGEVIVAVHMRLKGETPNKYRYTEIDTQQPKTGDIYIWKGTLGAEPPERIVLSIKEG